MSQLDDKGPSGPFSYPMKPDVFFGQTVVNHPCLKAEACKSLIDQT